MLGITQYEPAENAKLTRPRSFAALPSELKIPSGKFPFNSAAGVVVE